MENHGSFAIPRLPYVPSEFQNQPGMSATSQADGTANGAPIIQPRAPWTCFFRVDSLDAQVETGSESPTSGIYQLIGVK
jgi:hypothetical protein